MTEHTDALRGALARDGFAVVDLASRWRLTPDALRERAGVSPHAFAAALLGVEPLLVERQPIRPVDGARAFAASRAEAPLHTDSQLLLGIPAAVQVLVCIRRAPSGGESVLADGAALLARLSRDAPALAEALVATERTQRFYFGDVAGPTVALRGGHLAWTLAPRAEDPVGVALAPELAREPRVVRALDAGEALVASNHRMLHGRLPFRGERELVRLLVWLPEAPSWGAQLRLRARVAAPGLPPDALVRLRAVLAVLRGVPPAKAARDAGVDEATLYAWRDRLTRASL